MAAYNSLRSAQRGGPTTTPQSEKAKKGQAKNAAVGYVFKIDKIERIKRFLILGSEDSFYQSGQKLTMKRMEDIEHVAQSDGAKDLIDLIVDVSVKGRAPKQDPALFALALVIVSATDPEVKAYGYAQVDKVARTGTTLFMFAGFLRQLQGSGFGMGARKAFKRWYENKEIDSLAYQLVKYKNREGWTHADLIKLARPTKSSESVEFKNLMDYVLEKDDVQVAKLPNVIQGSLAAHKASKGADVAKAVEKYRLSWEMLPSEHLNDAQVWNALLDGNVPLGALIRQLPRLTEIGILKDLGGRTQEVVDRLTDQEALIKARIHPLNILLALKTYASGRSLRGSGFWTPNKRIIDALDKAFYLAFAAVEPTGKRHLIGVDVSGSMTSPIAGMPISSSEAAAALALVTANVEPETHIVGFDYQVRDLGISKKMLLPEVSRKVVSRTFGATDTAALIRYARENKLEVDVFVTITDNDTWAGQRHTFQELEAYRKETGIQAKSIVLATYASKFSIADPSDPLSLDLAGFDTSVPQVMSAFVRD